MFLEEIKKFFWEMPVLSDRQKQIIFYWVKGRVKGEKKEQAIIKSLNNMF